MSENNKTGFPSIDKPWLKYYTATDLENIAPHISIFENIYRNNSNHPEDIALIYYGKKISYRTLFENVELVEKAFLSAGVKEGDNVAFLMLSCPEMVYAILALNKIGACANMINPTFTAEQMRDRINDSEADIILILDQLYDRLAPVASEICPKVKVIVPIEQSMPLNIKAFVHEKLKKDIPMNEGVVRWKDFIKSGNGNKVHSAYTYKESMPAVMVYSSGTTGASKGIVLTNDGINRTIAHYDKEEFSFKRGDTFLHMGASWFSTFMIICLLMPLQKGIAVIIEPVFSEETFFKGLKKYKPVLTLGPASLWLYVISHANADEIDFSNMKYPITGGEKVLPETENAINEYLKNQGCKSRMIIGYGMCELGSTAVTVVR